MSRQQQIKKIEFDEDKFYQKYCIGCGSLVCGGVRDTIAREGCKHYRREIEERNLEEVEKITEEQQIEEMKDIVHNLWDKLNQDAITTNDIISALYNASYRKIDKDSVVLSKEEYEILKIKEKEKHWLETCMSVWKNAKIDGSKETAEKFLQLAYDRCLEKSFIKKVEELAKQFGVEIME